MASKYHATHKHQCPDCETVWEHNALASGIDALHACPKAGCGGRSFMLYDGDEPAVERTIVSKKRRREMLAEQGETDDAY